MMIAVENVLKDKNFIRNFYEAGAKSEAIQMIERLNEMYPSRPAMLDELADLKNKLSK